MTAGEQVKHLAPPGAKFYRLSHTRSDGSLRFIPDSAKAMLIVGAEPQLTATGTYKVVFFSEWQRRIDVEQDYKITVDGRTQNAYFDRMEMQSELHPKADKPADSGSDVDTRSFAERMAEGALKESHTGTREEAEEDGDEEGDDEDESIDSRESTHDNRVATTATLIDRQWRLEKMHQEMVRESIHTREVGEAYQLNAMMRRSFTELVAFVGTATREQSESVLRMSRMVSRQLRKLPPPPPPPPPPPADVAGVIKEALTAFQNIGLAIIEAQTEKMRLVHGQLNIETSPHSPSVNRPRKEQGQANSSRSVSHTDLRDTFSILADVLDLDAEQLEGLLTNPSVLEILKRARKTAAPPVAAPMNEEEGDK